jgi:predicted transposase YdaD
MFQLTPLSKTRAGQEIREEGRREGELIAKQTIVRNCLAHGFSIKETANLTGIPLAEVRRLAKDAAK